MRRTRLWWFIVPLLAASCEESTTSADGGMDAAKCTLLSGPPIFTPDGGQACGQLPCALAAGCGCLDGVRIPICVRSQWQCPDNLLPRETCPPGSGFTDGSVRGDAASDL